MYLICDSGKVFNFKTESFQDDIEKYCLIRTYQEAEYINQKYFWNEAVVLHVEEWLLSQIICSDKIMIR